MEIFIKISSYLDLKDIVRLSSTCRQMNVDCRAVADYFSRQRVEDMVFVWRSCGGCKCGRVLASLRQDCRCAKACLRVLKDFFTRWTLRLRYWPVYNLRLSGRIPCVYHVWFDELFPFQEALRLALLTTENLRVVDFGTLTVGSGHALARIFGHMYSIDYCLETLLLKHASYLTSYEGPLLCPRVQWSRLETLRVDSYYCRGFEDFLVKLRDLLKHAPRLKHLSVVHSQPRTPISYDLEGFEQLPTECQSITHFRCIK